MLEDFKSEMLQNLAMKMDTLHRKENKRKQRGLWPLFSLDAPGGILRINAH